jgi:hypothetical protein
MLTADQRKGDLAGGYSTLSILERDTTRIPFTGEVAAREADVPASAGLHRRGRHGDEDAAADAVRQLLRRTLGAIDDYCRAAWLTRRSTSSDHVYEV